MSTLVKASFRQYQDGFPVALVGADGSPVSSSAPLNIGSQGDDIIPTLAVTAGAYLTDQCVGGLLTLSNFLRAAGASAMIGGAMLNSKIAISVEIDLIIFRANPSASTFTNNVAAVLHANDAAKVARVAPFSTWIQPVGAPSFSQVDGLNRLLTLASGVDAYAALVTKGAVTFSSTSDLSLSVTSFKN